MIEKGQGGPDRNVARWFSVFHKPSCSDEYGKAQSSLPSLPSLFLPATARHRILVVDDETEIATLLGKLLKQEGYDVWTLDDPRLAINAFQSFKPELCILDFRMPHLSGATLLEAFKATDPTAEVIFMTADNDATLAIDLMRRGSADLLLKPVDLARLLQAVSHGIEHRRTTLENAAHHKRLEQLVAEKTHALNDALRSLSSIHASTLNAFAMALDYRDQSTSGHSRRVAELTVKVAQRIGMTGDELLQVEYGALLHDVGKLKIPDSILLKPSRLSDVEWVTMRKHPQYGYEFLRSIEFLREAADLVLAHHERFDGDGYPNGLKGHEIPLGARIFCIIDAFDAMFFKRSYNAPKPFHEIASEIRRCAATQFDPALIPTALEFLEEYASSPRIQATAASSTNPD